MILIRCLYCDSIDVMELRWCTVNETYKLTGAPEDYTGEMACNECCSTFLYEEAVDPEEPEEPEEK